MRPVLVGAAALALACGTPSEPPSRPVESLVLGGDVSALTRIEAAGGVFRDSGQVRDALAILRAHGANTFRLRLFVAPNDSDVQVNDLPYTIALATRVKATGAKLLLDIHYSDTWADPAHQTTPAAWAALPFDSLERRVETYTADVVRQLKQAGALPDIVQIGNEIDAGILWPLGRVGGSYDTPAQWDQFTRLLKAGIRGARAPLDPADSLRILLHYSQGGTASGTQWLFDHITGAGVSFDIIGFSYYPWWHGTLSRLALNLDATARRYDKDIVVVESSYPWRAGGWETMVADTSAMAWAASTAGQARFVSDLVSVVRRTRDNRGAGVLWWYPEAIPVPGLFVFAGGSLALFDSTHNVLPAAAEFSGR